MTSSRRRILVYLRTAILGMFFLGLTVTIYAAGNATSLVGMTDSAATSALPGWIVAGCTLLTGVTGIMATWLYMRWQIGQLKTSVGTLEQTVYGTPGTDGGLEKKVDRVAINSVPADFCRSEHDKARVFEQDLLRMVQEGNRDLMVAVVREMQNGNREITQVLAGLESK